MYGHSKQQEEESEEQLSTPQSATTNTVDNNNDKNDLNSIIVSNENADTAIKKNEKKATNINNINAKTANNDHMKVFAAAALAQNNKLGSNLNINSNPININANLLSHRSLRMSDFDFSNHFYNNDEDLNHQNKKSSLQNANENNNDVLASKLGKTNDKMNSHARRLTEITENESITLESKKSVETQHLSSKQELLFGLAQGLNMFTSNANTWVSNNKNNNSIGIESSENEFEWECDNVSKREVLKRLESKYLKLFFMVGVEGSGHHLWRQLFEHWDDYQSKNSMYWNDKSSIYFDAYKDDSTLTNCLHA